MLAESRAQYDKALRLFGRLAEVEPTSPEGLFRFGRLLLREARDQGLARRASYAMYSDSIQKADGVSELEGSCSRAELRNAESGGHPLRRRDSGGKTPFN